MKLGVYLLVTIGLLAALLQAGAQTSFVLSANYPAGIGTSFQATPYAVTAFMNADGRVDLVTANLQDGTLMVLTNDGSGNFASNATYAVGRAPDSIAAADVNGDGYVDLICANQADGTVTVLTNNGSGGFASNATYNASFSSSPFSVVAADVNGDGYMDLICGNFDGNLTVLTNDGSGGFVLDTNVPAVFYVQSVTTADVNGDGNVDLIAANFGTGPGFLTPTLTVLTNNGSGGFGLKTNLPMGAARPGSTGPASVTAADVNGDGKVDLITANYQNGTLTILTNNGIGGFVLDTNIPSGVLPVFVTAADVNGDGKVDLICANVGNPSSSVTMLTNNGSGGFALATNIAMSYSGANWIAAADFNGDGKVDFASANRNSNSVSVFFNTSIFPPPVSTPPLDINPSGSGIEVSWPSVSPGWSLRQNSDLTTTNWGPSGYGGHPISDDGTNKCLTIPFTVGNMYFRLLHP